MFKKINSSFNSAQEDRKVKVQHQLPAEKDYCPSECQPAKQQSPEVCKEKESMKRKSRKDIDEEISSLEVSTDLLM